MTEEVEIEIQENVSNKGVSQRWLLEISFRIQEEN